MSSIDIALLAQILTFQVVDLTHEINEHARVWDGRPGFKFSLTADYAHGGFRAQEYTIRSCMGTHIDTPAHRFLNGQDASSLDITHCIVPACIIDVSHKAHETYGVSVDDIRQWEEKHGKIKPHSVVLFSTGWAKRWHTPEKFRNEKNGTVYMPYIKEEAAHVLLQRDIIGIGIDTFSPDSLAKTDTPVHDLILGAGKYIIENVAHLDDMPATNGYIIVLPLKIKGGVESPLRLIGLKPHKR